MSTRRSVVIVSHPQDPAILVAGYPAGLYHEAIVRLDDSILTPDVLTPGLGQAVEGLDAARGFWAGPNFLKITFDQPYDPGDRPIQHTLLLLSHGITDDEGELQFWTGTQGAHVITVRQPIALLVRSS